MISVKIIEGKHIGSVASFEPKKKELVINEKNHNFGKVLRILNSPII